MNTSSVCHSTLYKKLWIAVILFIVVILSVKPVMRVVFPVLYTDEIRRYSTVYEIDEHLVMAVISAESKFDKNAQSHKGAKGLMQIREKTAEWCMEKFGIDGDIDNLYNPGLNINIGCAYISYLLEKFGGDICTTLAAYNAGEGNVKRWLEKEKVLDADNIPFEETRNYVKRVSERKNIYHFLY